VVAKISENSHVFAIFRRKLIAQCRSSLRYGLKTRHSDKVLLQCNVSAHKIWSA